MVLVSVCKILTFGFHHLIISAVRCSSCLWLELVPPVLLLPLSVLLGVQLSLESQWSEHSLQANSPLAGKVHRGLAFRPSSWPKMKARNKACPRRCVVSAVCTLTCTDWSLRDTGHKMALSPALVVRALQGRHLPQGMCPDVWSPKRGLSQKLSFFYLSQKLCLFFSLLAHP